MAASSEFVCKRVIQRQKPPTNTPVWKAGKSGEKKGEFVCLSVTIDLDTLKGGGIYPLNLGCLLLSID